MADMVYGGDRDGGGHARRIGVLVTLSGALVSLALIGGLAFWGYRLLVRDVTGVPVVRALDGPIRVAPEHPGGTTAAHQGLAVNEIAAVGTAGGPADAVTLAPAPTGLSDEDAPAEVPSIDPQADPQIDPGEGIMAAGSGGGAVPQSAIAPETDQARTAAPDLDEDRLAEETGVEAVPDAPADAQAIDRAVAEALGGLDMGPETLDPMSYTEEASDELLNDTADDGPARSPRPLRRPMQAAPMALDAAGKAFGDGGARLISISAPGAGMIEAAALSPGTHLVQLGSYSSREDAQAQWLRIGGRFADYFDGKRRVVQRVTSGGRGVWRLRAEGFRDLAEARRFCAVLRAESADCVPLELR